MITLHKSYGQGKKNAILTTMIALLIWSMLIAPAVLWTTRHILAFNYPETDIYLVETTGWWSAITMGMILVPLITATILGLWLDSIDKAERKNQSIA